MAARPLRRLSAQPKQCSRGLCSRTWQAVSLHLSRSARAAAPARLMPQRDGLTVHDCHAEVLAKRGLRVWLCSQLLRLAQGESSMFQRGQGARLRPGLRLHLYVRVPPCGDACVFQQRRRAPSRGGSAPLERSGLLTTGPFPEQETSQCEPHDPRYGRLLTKKPDGEGTHPP